MIGIYKITSPSGKVYIGQSSDIEKRFKTYKGVQKAMHTQIKLKNSLIKYGSENHIFEVIEECLLIDLNEKERYYQEFYNVLSKKGLNCVLVETDNCKRVMSEETKQKISLANKGKVQSEKLKAIMLGNTFMLGKKQSADFCKKISLVHKGNKYNVGKKLSNETKQKLSLSRIGNTYRLGKKKSKKEIENYIESASKVVLDLNTGVFYKAREYAELYQISYSTLRSKLNGNSKNNTSLIYV